MRLLIAASFITILFLGSCSQNESSIDTPQTGIGFSATAPKASRAAATTTASLQKFIVYAYTESTILMDGVTVSRDGGSWTYSPIVYWPGTAVNFYAISPDMRGYVPESSDGSHTIREMTYGGTDLIYAVSLNQHERPTPVNLTFRHAMSKIAVMLSSTNSKYNIKVYHVLLRNIFLKGDFSLPDETTTNATGEGEWENLDLKSDAMVFYDHGTPISLSSTPVDITSNNLDASFFVPQPLDPLSFTTSGQFSGGYIQVDCEIIDKTSGKKIWPSEYTPDYLLVDNSPCGRMLFPLLTADVKKWHQGYSYIYNIIINNSYVLDTIEFQPGVIDFTEEQPY